MNVKAKALLSFPKEKTEETSINLGPKISSLVSQSRITFVILFIKVMKHGAIFGQDDLQIKNSDSPSCEVTYRHSFVNL